MPIFQLISYSRIEDHFLEHMEIPVSTGSLLNFTPLIHEAMPVPISILKYLQTKITFNPDKFYQLLLSFL